MDSLCTGCLCAGRNLSFIRKTEYSELYSQILTEIQVYITEDKDIKVCWECLAHLRRWQLFKQRAKYSYMQLQYIQQNHCTDYTADPPHLTSQLLHSLSYPEVQIKTELLDNTAPQADNVESSDNIKMEDTHCEPETFVNTLNLEPMKKKKENKKAVKPMKDKSKRNVKLKPKKKSPTKSLKIKKRLKSPSPELSPADYNGDDDMYVDEKVGDMVNTDHIEHDIKDVAIRDNEVDVKIDNNPSDNEISRLNIEPKPVIKKIAESLPDKPYCAECGKQFSSKKTYRYHINVLHKGQNRYPCPHCGKIYHWKSNLGRHLRSHKARESGELFCETCNKHFASVATYRQHLRVSKIHVSENEFSYMCNECGKKFVNKTRLRDHIDWEHLKKIKFRCNLCNKAFKCHTSMYIHMQNVHRDKEKKDNLCHVCGKSYKIAAKLKYHIIAMHTSETPYQCQRCSAAFGWYSSLYRHVREVHYKMKLQPNRLKKSKKTEDIEENRIIENNRNGMHTPPNLPPLIPPLLQAMHQPGPP